MSKPAYLRSICFQLPSAASDTAVVPDWVPYMPAPDAQGYVTGEDGRRWKLGTLDNVRALAASIRRKQPVDINHAKEFAAPNGGESPAVGWITEYRVNEDGTTSAKVDWTRRGTNALQDREYGFISPSFDHDSDFVIRRYAGASLVNDPNFEMRGLNARETTEQPSMKKILAFLGLAETATEDEAVTKLTANAAELTRVTNAAQNPELTRFVPRADYDNVLQRATNAEQQLSQVRKETLEKEVDAELDAAQKAGKIPPATRDYHRANCLREGGLKAFRDYIATVDPVVTDPTRQQRNPATGGNGALNADERATCARLGIAEADFLKTRDAK